MISIREVAPGAGHYRATIPDQGPTGTRQVGYALPLGNGRYLVRIPNALAKTITGREEAIALLRNATT